MGSALPDRAVVCALHVGWNEKASHLSDFFLSKKWEAVHTFFGVRPIYLVTRNLA